MVESILHDPERLGDTMGIGQLAQGRNRKDGLEESSQRKYLPSAAGAALHEESESRGNLATSFIVT